MIYLLIITFSLQDRKPCIWAHRANCTGGPKKNLLLKMGTGARWNKFHPPVTFFKPFFSETWFHWSKSANSSLTSSDTFEPPMHWKGRQNNWMCPCTLMNFTHILQWNVLSLISSIPCWLQEIRRQSIPHSSVPLFCQPIPLLHIALSLLGYWMPILSVCMLLWLSRMNYSIYVQEIKQKNTTLYIPVYIKVHLKKKWYIWSEWTKVIAASTVVILADELQ